MQLGHEIRNTIEVADFMSYYGPAPKDTLQQSVGRFEELKVCPGLLVERILQDIAEYANECRHRIED